MTRASDHDLVAFVVARICDQFGIENALIRRWGEGSNLPCESPGVS